MHLFCFGLGYSAGYLARRLRERGWRISGTCRSAEKVRELESAGIEAFVFDGAQPLAPAGRRRLGEADHLLVSVPPSQDGDLVLRHHHNDLAARPDLAWLGYLSTTGVYGDRGGAWVDETSPPSPGTERAERRLAAEADWLALFREHGLPVHLFRLAGIYGPGRSALEAVRNGRARRILKPGQVFSRIHVADIARVIEASMARPAPGRIYNVCDDRPAPAAEVTARAAELLDLAPPPAIAFDEADLSPMARSFYEECRRVSNRRIKDELGVTLAYPDYEAGLSAMLAAGREEGRAGPDSN